MTNAFISSTSKDLAAYRQAAIDTCLKLELFPVAMEHFEAMGVGATAGSKLKVEKTDVYVGIFAHRYGYIEAGHDKGVTEIEFDYAGERGLERLCFLVDPKHPWPRDADDEKPEYALKLRDFKNRLSSGLIRAQFTDVNDFTAKLMHALVEWQKRHPTITAPSAAVSASALFARDPDDLSEKPRKLFGRDELQREVTRLLDQGERVLLQGFGGMGKTALAATLAADWIRAHKGPVLWLKTGSTSADALFEALARPFNAQQAVAAGGDAKPQLVRQLLRDSGAKLLVLDDCWNGAALFTLLKAVPSDLPILASARQRYALDKIREVGELTPEDALKLLSYHADQDFTLTEAKSLPTVGAFSPRPDALAEGPGVRAVDLCARLGYHAFALEIAGKNLKAGKLTPAELLIKIKDAPHEMQTPADFGETERRSVKDLLDTSLNALEADARAVFLAFGAFFAPQVTGEMVARYFVDKPEISDERLSAIRQQVPDVAGLLDEELRPLLQQVLLRNINAEPVQKSLDTLLTHGLVERVADSTRAGMGLEIAPTYRLHDLAFSYVRAQNREADHNRALDACLSYLARYAQPSADTFAALLPELDNLLGAAEWSFTKEYYYQGEELTQRLYAGEGNGGILHNLGYMNETIQLLEFAARTAKAIGKIEAYGVHLGNLGLAYEEIGRHEKAIELTENALSIVTQFKDQKNEVCWLGNLGLIYRRIGETGKAIEYFKKTLSLSQKTQNLASIVTTLSNLASIFNDLGRHQEAIQYCMQGLQLKDQLKDQRAESSLKSDIGIALCALGQTEAAIQCGLEALTIACQIIDLRGEENALGALGNTYNAAGQVDEAVKFYKQALSIARDLSDDRNEARWLAGLGNVYTVSGQTQCALDYYRQARAIFVKINAPHLVAQVERLIAEAEARLGGGG